MQNQMSGMNISGNYGGGGGVMGGGYNGMPQQSNNMPTQNIGAQGTQQPTHNWGAPPGQTLSTNLWQ